jgi:chemotaxis protein methyltransferase CheR
MKLLNEQQLLKFADIIKDKFGLEFTPERREDLNRVMSSFISEASPEEPVSGFIERCLRGGLTEREREILIDHLTIGETYFFREPRALKIIEQHILKPLSGKGSGRDGAVRIWSAACASGEEPYTFAIMGDQFGIPMEIVATDLDSRALMRARKAVYRKWSFRNEQALALKERYFETIGENSFKLSSEIAARVNFMKLNLVKGMIPASMESFDLILCRNVLMYFCNSVVGSVLNKMHKALAEQGHFVSTASESCLILEHGNFHCKNIDGLLLFSKHADSNDSTFSACEAIDKSSMYEAESNSLSIDDSLVYEEFSSGYTVDDNNTISGNTVVVDSYSDSGSIDQQYSDSMSDLKSDSTAVVESDHAVSELLLKGRELLNSGDCEAAREICMQILEVDHITPEAYYLLGEINFKDRNTDEALKFFRKTLYADSGIVMADVMLGNIYLDRGDLRSASVHFRSALRNLCGCEKDDIIKYSGDLTAGRLAEMIEKLATVCEDRQQRNRITL